MTTETILQLVHVTGPDHKVHHASIRVDMPDLGPGRPYCGSERRGTYRNAITTRAITCQRCIRREGEACTLRTHPERRF